MKSMAELLLVDDNPADIDLTSEILEHSWRRHRVRSVSDGVEAIAFLRGEGKYAGESAPDLIMLDLNLPRKDGRAVLAEIKADPGLRGTPIVVFSTSHAQRDILGSYELGANSYVCKPGNLKDFESALKAICDFWCGCVVLPGERKS